MAVGPTTNSILRRSFNASIDAIKVDVVQTVGGGGGSSATQSTFNTGAKSSIGATEVQLTSSSVSAAVGVLIRADKNNTLDVFVGNSGLTAGSSDSTDGMLLAPGETLTIEVNNANKVYVISTGGSQKVYWMAV